MPSWGSMPGRDVKQPRKTGQRYQTYYRDPLTRKFVAIEGVQVQLETGLKEPKLSDGIPTLSYFGVRLWRR